MDFTNRYDVRDWLDGAAKFFGYAFFISFIIAFIFCLWGVSYPYDFKKKPILRKAEIVFGDDDDIPTFKPTKVINSYIADDKAVVETVKEHDGSLGWFRIVTHTTSYFGCDVVYVWANIDNAKSCKLLK